MKKEYAPWKISEMNAERKLEEDRQTTRGRGGKWVQDPGVERPRLEFTAEEIESLKVYMDVRYCGELWKAIGDRNQWGDERKFYDKIFNIFDRAFSEGDKDAIIPLLEMADRYRVDIRQEIDGAIGRNGPSRWGEKTEKIVRDYIQQKTDRLIQEQKEK